MDKHHILVVDDNHINRLFFESSLKKLDLIVSLAENGFQAIEMCQHQNFDLILMDIRMDGLDGIQTAAEIKAILPHRDTPILAVSAERFDFKQHPDFADSLLKPISQEKLKSVLSTYLSHIQLNPIYFNQQQALNISHQDSEIVAKLRTLLVRQLPDDWLKIEQFYNLKDWSNLDACLHKLLGSAKICAADVLVQHIKVFKSSISQQQSNDVEKRKLKSAIDNTIEAAVVLGKFTD